MNTEPNIFDYATSELTQDAFLTWLLNWAKKEYNDSDQKLHALAVKFLKSLLQLKGIELTEDYQINVIQQYKKIDVFVELEMNGKSYAIILEDKVHSKNHSDQLIRYLRFVEGLNKYEGIVPVYFKTGYQHSFDDIVEKKYCVYTIKDLFKVLNESSVRDIQNDVLSSYFLYMSKMYDSYELADYNFNGYHELPIKDWSWWSCAGFFNEASSELNAEWGPVGNNRQPILACWLRGIDLTITDADTGKPITFDPYIDVVFTEHEKMKVNFRMGLKEQGQSNNKNRNMVYWLLHKCLEGQDIDLKKAHFRAAKETLKLAEIQNLDMNMTALEFKSYLLDLKSKLYDIVNVSQN